MAFWDIFKQRDAGGLSRPVRRNLSRLTNKWIDAAERYNAMDRLLEMGSDEGYGAALKRFTFLIDNTIKDNEEKRYLYDRLKEIGGDVVEPIIAFMKVEDEISWPLKALSALVDEDKLTATLITLLTALDPVYSRRNSKKVILLDMLKERPNPEVYQAVEPFLEDTDDDVRIKAIETVAHEEYRSALLDKLVKMMVDEGDRPRIRIKAAEELARLGWEVRGVEGYGKERIEESLPAGFRLDGKFHLKQRQ
ncbi:HEAT repeat domain-containing protein [bacterium]|nr:HEAT repeat domain-containing protein [candidate division CSSED10-310 bacterium]